MYKIGISERHVFEWLMAPCIVHPTRDMCTLLVTYAPLAQIQHENGCVYSQVLA